MKSSLFISAVNHLWPRIAVMAMTTPLVSYGLIFRLQAILDSSKFIVSLWSLVSLSSFFSP